MAHNLTLVLEGAQALLMAYGILVVVFKGGSKFERALKAIADNTESNRKLSGKVETLSSQMIEVRTHVGLPIASDTTGGIATVTVHHDTPYTS